MRVRRFHFGAAVAFSQLLVLAFAAVGAAAPISYNSEASWLAAVGSTTTVDFDSLGTSVPVSNQYAGVVFAGSPLTSNFAAHSPANSIIGVPQVGNGGGGWSAVFSSPVDGFALWSFDVQFAGSQVRLFDVGGSEIGNFDLLTTGGGHGPFSWGFNGFYSAAGDISRVELVIGPTDFVMFDDLQFSVDVAPVPEPGTTLLVALSGLAAAVRRSRRRAIR